MQPPPPAHPLLLALKGHPGTGKSALGRALGRELGWPVVDKDDVKDVLDGRAPEAGGLAYEVMFAVARRQLRLGLSTICDSPLVSRWAFEQAQRVAAEAGAAVAVVECRCRELEVWRARIERRRELGLPAHHQTSWAGLQAYLERAELQACYPIAAPRLVIDTSARPLADLVAEVTAWLAQQVWPR
jgi:predicted kinase